MAVTGRCQGRQLNKWMYGTSVVKVQSTAIVFQVDQVGSAVE